MKLSLSTTWHVWGSSSTAPLIPKFCTWCRWGVFFKDRPLCPSVAPQRHSGSFEKENNLQKIDLRFLDHPFPTWVNTLTELSGSQDTKRISEAFLNSTSRSTIPRSSIPYLSHYTNWTIRLPRHKENIRRFCKLHIAQKSKTLQWKRNTTGNSFCFRWLIVHLQSELGYVYLLLPASAVNQPPLPEMMDELINAVPFKNTYQLIQSLKQQTALNFVAGVSRWSLTEPAISRPGVHHQVQEPLEGHSDKAAPS